ncbi:hypothetical protein [Telmatospirillum sp. J64-1]|uniref:hypothetical protein n=1 Tax=Telmatospirillum sp. J64-1 TaxID=2502183 RepID=UPI00115D4E21|nr:hypothetical protein [Telmatospirillum sp. J64-1]
MKTLFAALVPLLLLAPSAQAQRALVTIPVWDSFQAAARGEEPGRGSTLSLSGDAAGNAVITIRGGSHSSRHVVGRQHLTIFQTGLRNGAVFCQQARARKTPVQRDLGRYGGGPQPGGIALTFNSYADGRCLVRITGQEGAATRAPVFAKPEHLQALAEALPGLAR